MEVLKNFYIFVARSYNKGNKKSMKVYYKPRDVDYEKTMAQLETEDGKNEITIPIAGLDLANIRAQVARYAQNKFPGRTFTVNKTPEGAKITRID